MSTVVTFDAFLADGIGPYRPDAVSSFRWPWASDVTLRGTLRHSDNTPVNLAGAWAITAGFKLSAGDVAPLIARQATVTDSANGIFEIYITANDRVLLTPGKYVCDIAAVDSIGMTSIHYEIVQPSRVDVFGTIYAIGDPVSVPSFQQPLARGPQGIQGVQGNQGIQGTQGIQGPAGPVPFVNVKDYGAFGNGTADDGPACQAALDAVGAAGRGIVYFPSGTYIIGTPFLNSSKPLFVWSNTTVLGAGRNNTILKCTNEARMHRWDLPVSYPSAAVISNKNSPSWLPNMSAATADTGITIKDLSIDGNAIGQPSICIPGNRTQEAVQDNFYAITAVGVAGGGLISGHTYSVGVTYTDSMGRETAARNVYGVTLGGGQGTIRITFPPAPANAVQMVIYVRDETVDPNDTYGNNDIYERHAPQTIIQNGATFDIASHTAGNVYIPGFGLVGQAEGSVSYGISLANCGRCLVDNVEIYECCLDGLAVSLNAGRLVVSDSVFQNIWIRRCNRDGISVTGAADTCVFSNIIVSGSGQGCDIESDFNNIPVRNILFYHCTFRGSWNPGGFGLGLVTFQGSDMTNIVIDSCLFDQNLGHLQLGGPTGLLYLRVSNCLFTRALNNAVVVSGGDIDFEGSNQFIQNGYAGSYYVPSAQPGNDIVLQSSSAQQRVRVDGAYFESLAGGANGINLSIVGSNPGHQISNCRGTGPSTNALTLIGDQTLVKYSGLSGNWIVQGGGPGYNRYFDGAVGITTIPQTAAQDAKKFAVAVGAAQASLVVTFNVALAAFATYQVVPTPHWNWGAWWITGQSSTGFTLNWSTVPGGGGSTLDWLAIS